jgi:hypothetical protein
LTLRYSDNAETVIWKLPNETKTFNANDEKILNEIETFSSLNDNAKKLLSEAGTFSSFNYIAEDL